MITIDTNCIIRHIVNDVPEQASKVSELLATESNVHIPEAVFPEIEYVLSKFYNIPKPDILKAYKTILSYVSIEVSTQTIKAVELYESYELDFADCLIAAHSTGNKLASFDKELLRTKGIQAYWS